MLKYLRKQNSNEEKGATMLEAAMVLPFALFFLFVSIDLFLFAYQAVAVQFLSTNLMRDVSTSADVRVSPVCIAARGQGDALLLKLSGAKQGGRVCLCPLNAISSPEQCRRSEIFCRDAISDEACENSSASGPVIGVTTPLPAGESFLIVLRYRVPQLFAFITQKGFFVDAVSIGRVEPRGVGQ